MRNWGRPLQGLAERELRRDLDFYVESFGVHTCARLRAVLWLLETAGWSGTRLLSEWAAAVEAGEVKP